MVDDLNIKELSNDVRKLYGLVNDHIGNINGHPFANVAFGGFQDQQSFKNSYFQGKRAIGFPSGVTSVKQLNFGLYYGSHSQFTDLPKKIEASVALIKVEGWGDIAVNGEYDYLSGGTNAQLKKITILIGQTENVRYVSSGGTYDSGWLNDEVWTSQTLVGSSSGYANAIKTWNGMTGNYRVDIEFNLTGKFNALKDIIQLGSGYVPSSANIIAFSGWGQTSTGATKIATFAIHARNMIEYVHTADTELTSINGYFSYLSGSPVN